MRVLFLTGSGLSADSGLPTFRGAGGLYEGMRAEEFLSARGYARHPEAVEQWLDTLRAAAAAAAPNAAHSCLGRAHEIALTGPRADAPSRCAECGARLRSDVVLFGELAPAYAQPYRASYAPAAPVGILNVPVARCRNGM
jgi:NAD-dependent SIR2 family protein deacetylase